MLPPVRVPVRPTVVSRSKQFEPLICTAPLTELPDTVILPAIVRGGVPGSVGVVLNCQLLTALTPGGFEVGLEGEPGVLPPPHPHSSTRTETSQEKLDGSLVASFIVPPPVSLESVTSNVATQNAPPAAESISPPSRSGAQGRIRSARGRFAGSLLAALCLDLPPTRLPSI